MLRKRGVAVVWALSLAIASSASAADAPTTSRSDPDALDLATPTLVSVHLAHAPVDVAARALAKAAHLRTRVEVHGHEDDFPLADFDLEQRPLLLALLDLSDTYKLISLEPRRGRSWSLAPRARWENDYEPVAPTWTKAPASLSGPFAVFAQETMRMRVLTTAGHGGAVPAPEPDELQLKLVIAGEPRVIILKFPNMPVIQTCVDDRGTDLAQNNADWLEPKSDAGDASFRQLVFQLRTPNRAATRIAKLSGYVRLVTVTQSRRAEFEDPGDNKTADVDFAGFSATITGAKEIGPQKPGPKKFETAITLHRGNTDSKVWSERLILLDKLRKFIATTTDAAGNTLSQIGAEVGNLKDADAYTFRLQLSQTSDGRYIGGPPAKYIVEVPISSGEVKVPFEFTNLPLPAD